MLTKPEAGWSDFQLEGTSVYGLSYLNDIAFEWVDQAICGLETLLPFCVEGFLEPSRFLCTVSYWNCHIICEDDDQRPLDEDTVLNEVSHTSMLQFCEFLCQDIKENIDEWAAFVSYNNDDVNRKKEKLIHKLKRLEELIAQKREDFGEDRCFC